MGLLTLDMIWRLRQVGELFMWEFGDCGAQVRVRFIVRVRVWIRFRVRVGSAVLFEKTTILEKLLLEASANPFLTYNKTHVKKLAPHCIVYTQT